MGIDINRSHGLVISKLNAKSFLNGKLVIELFRSKEKLKAHQDTLHCRCKSVVCYAEVIQTFFGGLLIRVQKLKSI